LLDSLPRPLIIASWIGAGLMVAVGLVNAVVMVVSPQRWFRMPSWLALRGTLTEQRYSSGWGSLCVRFLGAGIIAVFAYVALDLTVDRWTGIVPARHQIGYLVGRTLVAVTLAVLVANGSIMMITPRWQQGFPWWIRIDCIWKSDSLGGWRVFGIRLFGALIVALSGWGLWSLFV
jgi:hypothetical protein